MVLMAVADDDEIDDEASARQVCLSRSAPQADIPRSSGNDIKLAGDVCLWLTQQRQRDVSLRLPKPASATVHRAWGPTRPKTRRWASFWKNGGGSAIINFVRIAMLSTIAWDELSLKNNYVHLQCFAIHIRNIVARVCYICKIPWHPWGHPNVPCCSEGAPKCPLLLRGGSGGNAQPLPVGSPPSPGTTATTKISSRASWGRGATPVGEQFLTGKVLENYGFLMTS